VNTKAVIGCLFGDEGKGKVVSYLCSQSPNSLVIRYCGGQQAGHHVVLRSGLDHVFSNFGSGTLQGCDTYWSQYCSVDPIGILNEYDVLANKGIVPTLFVDERCPVTTPYDKQYNIMLNNANHHGSCGVGVGQTIQREQDNYSLLFGDLYFPAILKIKLELIRKYYSFKTYFDEFINSCIDLSKMKNIIPVPNIPNSTHYSNFIFEGSQGLLLDQHYGFFPHVTRGDTGIVNIQKMGFEPQEIFLVIRAYQTKHGNGPMTNENLSCNIQPNSYEKNFDNGLQGKFRTAILDLDLVKYAIYKSGLQDKSNVSLTITCLDLLDEYCLTVRGEKLIFKSKCQFIDKIRAELSIDKIFLSHNPFPEMVEFLS